MWNTHLAIWNHQSNFAPKGEQINEVKICCFKHESALDLSNIQTTG